MSFQPPGLYDFRNLILIGMPGAGKSTVGVLLAKALGMGFIDTDLEIQNQEGERLQSIVDSKGHLFLRGIEEQVCRRLDCDNCVVATGGSVVYSPSGMQALGELGRIIWLSVDLDEIERRVNNFSNRGLARAPGQSLADLFAEREPLYLQYSQITVDCAGLRPDQIVTEIVSRVAGNLAL